MKWVFILRGVYSVERRGCAICRLSDTADCEAILTFYTSLQEFAYDRSGIMCF